MVNQLKIMHIHTFLEMSLSYITVLLKITRIKDDLQALGYVFTSQTDTEVVAHLVHDALKHTDSLLEAVQKLFLN